MQVHYPVIFCLFTNPYSRSVFFQTHCANLSFLYFTVLDMKFTKLLQNIDDFFLRIDWKLVCAANIGTKWRFLFVRLRKKIQGIFFWTRIVVREISELKTQQMMRFATHQIFQKLICFLKTRSKLLIRRAHFLQLLNYHIPKFEPFIKFFPKILWQKLLTVSSEFHGIFLKIGLKIQGP